MPKADLAAAHKALQGLKKNPEALKSFHSALGALSASTGIPADDPTFSYVANTLVNQRLSVPNVALGRARGVSTVGGFHIAAAIKVD